MVARSFFHNSIHTFYSQLWFTPLFCNSCLQLLFETFVQSFFFTLFGHKFYPQFSLETPFLFSLSLLSFFVTNFCSKPSFTTFIDKLYLQFCWKSLLKPSTRNFGLPIFQENYLLATFLRQNDYSHSFRLSKVALIMTGWNADWLS